MVSASILIALASRIIDVCGVSTTLNMRPIVRLRKDQSDLKLVSLKIVLL